MTIESVILDRLLGFAGLVALIGDRVHAHEAPQGVVVPFITFEQISEIREPAFGQWIDALTSRFQIDVWASTGASRNLVRRQVIKAVKGWIDRDSSPVVFGCHVENYQGPPRDEMGIYRGIVDLILNHREE